MLDAMSALLDARSPGERTEAAIHSKSIKAAAPRHRVKSLVKAPKAGDVAAQTPQTPAAPVPSLPQEAPIVSSSDAAFEEAVSALETVPVTVQQAALLPPAGGSGGAGGGGLIFAPPGGGGGGGSIGNPPPDAPTGTPPATSPVSPVPEPGTWLMMLLGFGFIGFSMRRHRESRRPQTSPASV
jgi:hypothetical protein